MAIATEREATVNMERPGSSRPDDSIAPPPKLLDLLAASSSDTNAWRDALTRECVAGLSPGAVESSEAPDWRGYWLHGCATGCAAARIAELTGLADARISFAAGLLHDIGKLALARRFPRSYARAIEIAVERSESILEAETALFEIDHTLAGRRLVEHWCLPRSIVDAVWLHHQPAASLPQRATRDLVNIVAIANALARRRWPGWGTGCDDAGEHAVQLGLVGAALADVEHGLAEEVDRLQACFAGGSRDAREDGAGAAVLSALQRLSPSLRPENSIAELCAIAAESVVTGLNVPGACILAAAEGSDLLEIGAATAAGRVWDRLPLISDGSPLAEVSVLRVCGASVLPIPPQCGAILERYCGPAAGIASWALALMQGGRLVGALLLRAGAARLREFTSDAAPSATLLSLLPALLGPAVAAAASAVRGEELALGARRLGDVSRKSDGQRNAAAMAEFASGAAHELNTPLAVIAGRASQLLSWELDPELERAVSAIRDHVGRCAEIVSDLAAFADPPPPRPAALDIAALLRSVREAGSATGDFGAAECCVEISDDLPPAVADEEHLRTILRELLSNAIEATAGRARRLTIKAVRDRTDEQVVVSVADNGRGMAPDVRERAFDPFFSQRPAGRGRGLGLSRVRRLATLNGGQVRLKSEVGRGTVVEVTLPISHID